MRRHTLPILVLGIMAVVASACSSVTPTTTASANGSGPSRVYVALGNNGLGASRFPTNVRAAWTQMFYSSALGTSGTFYDFSMADQTVAAVLGQELAQVQAVHPDLVTVWLSTADIVNGTDVATFGSELRQLVGALRRQGATVLVANAVPPALESAFDVCTGRFGGCSTADPAPTSGVSPGAAASAVTAYDGTIALVARQTGAFLVDVQSVLAHALQVGGVGSIVTPDGASLSEQGAALVARTFLAKLPASFTKPH
jgi:GDSL-like lipase/acylhydrolase family protein